MSLRNEINSVVTLLKNMGYILALLGMLWMTVHDTVQEWVQDFVGSTSTHERIDNLEKRFTDELGGIRRNIGELRTDVDVLTPPIRLVEWDVDSSRLIGPCYIGAGSCEILLRARRTSAGLPCGAPASADMWVRTHAGELHRVRPALDWEPIRLTKHFESFRVAFIPPPVGDAGQAYFFAINQYTGCTIKGDPAPTRKTAEFPLMLQNQP